MKTTLTIGLILALLLLSACGTVQTERDIGGYTIVRDIGGYTNEENAFCIGLCQSNNATATGIRPGKRNIQSICVCEDQQGRISTHTI